MAISSKFSVAAHLLSLIALNPDERLSSETMAGSVNTNPVVVRRIIGMLVKAGLVRTVAGVAGATLARGLDEITLLDVYRAVRSDEELFSMHENPNPDCQVGRNIQGALDRVFASAQTAMERELAGVTLRQVASEIAERDEKSL